VVQQQQQQRQLVPRPQAGDLSVVLVPLEASVLSVA